MGNRGEHGGRERWGCRDERRGDWPGKPGDDMRDDWPGRPREDDMDVRDSGEFGFRRRFISRAEKLRALSDYLEELENEAEGVREAIDDLLDKMIEAGDFDDDEFDDEFDDDECECEDCVSDDCCEEK